MQFNDTSTKNGAIQKCEEWVFGGDYGAISGNSTLLLRFTNLLNSGLDKTKSLIYKSDNRWQDDDPNYDDIPDGTTDLSNAQQTYRLDRSHSIVEGFEVMNASGDYIPLTEIDYEEIRDSGSSKSEFESTAGLPKYYELKGDIVTLYPAPATGKVTMSDGLKIVYKRESDYYVSTDTTKEMGIPRMFQDLPVLFASNEYAKQNTMSEKARELDKEIEKRSGELKEHFSSRNKDEQLVITSETVISI